MKKYFLGLISLLWISVYAITPATAAGVGVGFTGAFISVDADGTETENSDTDDSSTRTKSITEDAFVAGYYVEFTMGENNGYAIGYEAIPGSAEFDAESRTDTETSVTSTAAETSNSRVFTADASVENFNVIYAEIPLGSMFYVRAGLSEIDVNTEEVKSGNGGNYPNATVEGVQYGVGAKGVFSANERIRWKLGYQMDDFDTLSLTSTGNSVTSETNKLTADLDTWSLKFARGMQF